MMKAILFVSSPFTSNNVWDIHLNNVYKCLECFSQVNIVHTITDVRIINKIEYACRAQIRLLNAHLDYGWARGVLTSLILKTLNRKRVVSIYDVNSLPNVEREIYGGNSFITRFLKEDEYRSLQYATIIRVHNSRLKESLIHYHEAKIPKIADKIHVVPIPIQTKIYRIKESFEFRKPTFVFVGSPAKWQGLEYFLKAFALLNDSRAGAVLYTPALSETSKRIIRELKLQDRVEQRFIPHHQLTQVLASHDVLVIPRASSIVTETATPFKLIESMACGLPILATNIGGVNEYIRHKENGYLVEAGNPRALSEGMREIIERPDLARSLGENARQFAEKTFDCDVISKQLEEIIKKYCHQLA